MNNSELKVIPQSPSTQGVFMTLDVKYHSPCEMELTVTGNYLPSIMPNGDYDFIGGSVENITIVFESILNAPVHKRSVRFSNHLLSDADFLSFIQEQFADEFFANK